MNCMWNLFLHKCPPSLCPHCFCGSLLLFLLFASTELIPFYLPNTLLPSEHSHTAMGMVWKEQTVSAKRACFFSQCSLFLPPQITSSCLREVSSDFLSGNHGLETKHFLCIYWSRSCSSELQVPQILLCLPCFFLSHNLTCCWAGDTAIHLFLWLSCGNTSERFGNCGRSLGV